MRDIYSILEDYLASRPLTPEEEKLIETWQLTDRNNDLLALLERMGRGAGLNNLLTNQPEVGLDSILQGIRQIKRRRRIRFYSSAAAVLLLLTVGTFFYFQSGTWGSKKKLSAASDSFRAEIVLPTGQIITLDAGTGDTIRLDKQTAWLNDAHTVKVTPATQTGKKITYSTMRVPAGGEYNIVLPDGTKVFMNSKSELTFPNYFPDNERRVILNGEAYFDVVADTTRPFIVDANDLSVNVLGTSFNINSYASMKSQAITLESGVVKVICREQEYMLDPGQQLRYNSITHQSEVREVNTELYTSWKDGYYFFQEVTLDEVMASLSHWYGITVIFEDEWSKKREFSGRMKRYDEVEVLLNHFVQTGEITYRKDANIVYIRKK